MNSPSRHLRRDTPRRPASLRRVLLSCSVALATTGLMGGLAPAAQAAHPNGPEAPAEAPDRVEPFAAYQPQSTCDPVAKPGTKALARLLVDYYGTGRSGGIVRNCSIGGRSEHKDGRALDWMLSVDRANERAVAEEFIGWLLDKGPDGKKAYNARRLGVMYVIWDRRIWSASQAKDGWQPYRGSNPHTDHIHISLTWSGAMKQTSFWTGKVADVGQDSDEPPDSEEPPDHDHD